MGEYSATIHWSCGDATFVDERYSRAHEWRFDGGLVVAASASPLIVPEPYSVPANVDPEEAFVAAIASCHMLFFLSLAAARRIVVDSYQDRATGTMKKNSSGQVAITDVELHPAAVYRDTPPVRAVLEALHEDAHKRCFIANSVKATISIQIVS